MALVFDISQEEIPLFLAETEDHIQTLDENLIRLERQANDPELLQLLFRAAHTLKGTAGMIGHKRLVAVTHALESLMDAVRKDKIGISTPLVDLCLESVDVLRVLRDEVVNEEPSNLDVEDMVNRFTEFLQSAGGTQPKQTSVPSTVVSSTVEQDASLPSLLVEAVISNNSIASAARAFQLMMALQELGTIVRMDPTQEEIETARPIFHFLAEIRTRYTPQEIRARLAYISEIDKIQVLAEAQNVEPGADEADEVAPEGKELERIGDFLVENGYITQEQLNFALNKKEPGQMLGQSLVRLNIISQERLDQALAGYIQKQRSTIQQMATGTDRLKQKSGDKTVRTSVERLDALMNLVGELITDRNRLYKIRDNLEVQMHNHDQISTLGDTVAHVSRITDQLQEEVMRIRMLPISNVFNKFPRLVRDLAQKAGKDIELTIRGEDTELDRSVIQEINDPLIHLLRNAVDHGIEPPEERVRQGKPARGNVILTARHEHGQIIITVEDDGKGISADRLRASAVTKGMLTEAEARALTDEKAIDLIFLSGVSTAREVTDISGRGVGMDIVRNNIERINGSMVVHTEPGKGTRFQIILPLTLAIVPTMLVKVGDIPIAIPLVMVIETTRVTPEEISTVRGIPVIRLRNHVLPLMNLKEVFNLGQHDKDQKYSYVVVVNSNKMQVGLIVDGLIGEEEVVVKSLGSFVGNVPGITSAAILGDGQVALIVDVAGLFKMGNIY